MFLTQNFMSYAALYMSCAAGIAKLYIKCYFFGNKYKGGINGNR